jgi:hypothetical protein
MTAYIFRAIRGGSSAGRAPGLQPGGRRFDPGPLHLPNVNLGQHLRCAGFVVSRAGGRGRQRSFRNLTSKRSALRAKMTPERRDGAQQPDGTWLLENTHPGKVHFALEDGDGRPSRWNTLRVLSWYEQFVA